MLAGRELITRLTGGQFERDRKAIGIDQCMNLTGHHLVTCPRTVFVPSDASSVARVARAVARVARRCTTNANRP